MAASPRIEAMPNRELLVWGREMAGLAPDVAAKRAGVTAERLLSWERGQFRPTVNQLRKLANIYKRPLAVFYLSQRPRAFQPMHDFRRLPEHREAPSPSPDLLLELRKARDRREWALELYDDLDEHPPVFRSTASLSDDSEDTAASVRSELGVSLAQQAEWRDGHSALRNWRLLLEASGVLTFQATGLELSEARGFSISERPLPAVVGNIKDAPRARVFTLLHELVHIMLDDGGICDVDEVVRPHSHDQQVETFCNRTAAAILLPKHELLSSEPVRRHGRRTDWSDLELEALSRRFGASREAILRRLLQLGLTNASFYRARRDQFLAEYSTRDQGAGFAPPHVVALTSAGPLFTRLVVDSFNRERITASDVADYLNVRLKHLAEIERDFARIAS